MDFASLTSSGLMHWSTVIGWAAPGGMPSISMLDVICHLPGCMISPAAPALPTAKATSEAAVHPITIPLRMFMKFLSRRRKAFSPAQTLSRSHTLLRVARRRPSGELRARAREEPRARGPRSRRSGPLPASVLPLLDLGLLALRGTPPQQRPRRDRERE